MSDIPKEYSVRATNVQKSLTDGLEKEIGSIFQSLVVEGNSNGKLPESIFVHSYLPYFCGEVKIEEGSDVLVRWISIAGTPSSPVDILEGNGLSEKVIYTVPGLIDTSFVEVNKRSLNDAYSTIFVNYDREKNNIPIVAQNNLVANLDTKLSNITNDSTSTLTESSKQWQSIFLRYGKVKANVTMSNKPVNKLNNLTDDDFTYD